MTLSVCIPVYNQDVTKLVSTLLKQTNDLVDIVLIDDHSNSACHESNSVFSNELKYIRLEENIGRSKIRNAFLNHTDSQYLLFLDCDSTIISNDFIASYLEFLDKEHPEVLVGSSVYQNEPPARKYRLRWKYGKFKESQPFVVRKANSNTSFKTNNFIISRDCFLKQSFNENLMGYGHEDTLFGYELNKNNIEIHQIDNPVLNGELDTNEEFIRKTEEGLGNLLKIWKIVDCDKDLSEKVKLLSYFQRYRHSKWLKLMFAISKIPVRTCLTRGWANLMLFDFYKLGYLIQLESNSKD